MRVCLLSPSKINFVGLKWVMAQASVCFFFHGVDSVSAVNAAGDADFRTWLLVLDGWRVAGTALLFRLVGGCFLLALLLVRLLWFLLLLSGGRRCRRRLGHLFRFGLLGRGGGDGGGCHAGLVGVEFVASGCFLRPVLSGVSRLNRESVGINREKERVKHTHTQAYTCKCKHTGTQTHIITHT